MGDNSGYNVTFRWGIYDTFDWETMEEFVSAPNQKLVVGLLSDELSSKFYDGKKVMPYVSRENFVKSFRFVENVIQITDENFSLEGVYNTLIDSGIAIPDSFIIGSEYGQLFEQDKEFAKSKGINLVFPSKMMLDFSYLKYVTSNPFRKYKIVLFGTGKWFDSYIDTMSDEYKPAYAVDNKQEVWGTAKAGINIKNPKELLNEEKKHLLIVVCAKNSDGIVEQLNELGDFDYRKLLVCKDNELAKLDEFRVRLRDERLYLKEIQGALTELLVEFDRVCTKYDLPYFLNCGSAIGAVRHHGFIPWDDDADVVMFQQDFDVLRSHADEMWPDSSDYRLVTPGDLGNGAFLDFMNRLMLTREHYDTNIFDKVKGKADESIQHTANLDIYILNNASPNPKKQKRNTLILQAIYGLGMGHRAVLNYDDYKNCDSFTRFVIRVTSMVGKVFPMSFIVWLHNYFARRFEKIETDLCFESNGYVKNVTFDKDIFGRGKKIEVCGHELMVAEEVERHLLAHGYKTFMELPPMRIRKPTHAINAAGPLARFHIN